MISKIDLLLIITNSNKGLLQKQCAYTIKTSLGGIEKISSDAKREDKRYKKKTLLYSDLFQQSHVRTIGSSRLFSMAFSDLWPCCFASNHSLAPFYPV